MLMGTNYTGWIASWFRLSPALGRVEISGAEVFLEVFAGRLHQLRTSADLLHLLTGGVAPHVLLVHDVAKVCALPYAVHDVLEHTLLTLRSTVCTEQPVPERPLIAFGHVSLLARLFSYRSVTSRTLSVQVGDVRVFEKVRPARSGEIRFNRFPVLWRRACPEPRRSPCAPSSRPWPRRPAIRRTLWKARSSRERTIPTARSHALWPVSRGARPSLFPFHVP